MASLHLPNFLRPYTPSPEVRRAHSAPVLHTLKLKIQSKANAVFMDRAASDSRANISPVRGLKRLGSKSSLATIQGLFRGQGGSVPKLSEGPPVEVIPNLETAFTTRSSQVTRSYAAIDALRSHSSRQSRQDSWPSFYREPTLDDEFAEWNGASAVLPALTYSAPMPRALSVARAPSLMVYDRQEQILLPPRIFASMPHPAYRNNSEYSLSIYSTSDSSPRTTQFDTAPVAGPSKRYFNESPLQKMWRQQSPTRRASQSSLSVYSFATLSPQSAVFSNGIQSPHKLFVPKPSLRKSRASSSAHINSTFTNAYSDPFNSDTPSRHSQASSGWLTHLSMSPPPFPAALDNVSMYSQVWTDRSSLPSVTPLFFGKFDDGARYRLPELIFDRLPLYDDVMQTLDALRR